MLRKIRITLATVFFIGITLLFLDFTGTIQHWTGWMAKLQLLPAMLALNVFVIVALVVLTLIFGRIYCSVICPLGIFQDVVARIGRIRRRNPYSFSKAKSWLRYGVLAIFIAAVILGIGSVVALLAPYSSYGRIAANLLQPIYIAVNNVFASIAEHADSYAFYHRDIWMRSLPTFIIALATFIIIGVLAWLGGRTYCNTICPVGTILSFLSRFSWLKIRFDEEKCRNCSKCTKNCKAACIDHTTHSVDYSRCVVCGNCLNQCKFGALRYGRTNDNTNDKNENRKSSNDKSGRRAFLIGTALATAGTALAQKEKKVDGGLAEIADKLAPERTTPLTPPGSLSAQNMVRHCTGCQLCVAECPNDVLRPSTSLLTLMQPTMSYERGYCRPECTRCSEVCPTKAIRPIQKDEKSSLQIGTAVWVKKNCLPVSDGVTCGNCARHCPAGAIEMVPFKRPDGTEVEVPAVNFSRCIGCGACENLCPARPFPAIYVEGHEVHKTI